MIVEEIPCGGCRRVEDVDERRCISPLEGGDKLAVVQCLDCDHHYCADCLLEHQIDTTKSSHRLVSLSSKRSSVDSSSSVAAVAADEQGEEEVEEEEAQEINNNDIMFDKKEKKKYGKPDEEVKGEENKISRRGHEDEDEDEEVNETVPDSSDLINGLVEVNNDELLLAAQIAALGKLADPQLLQQQQQQQQKALFSARSIEALRQFVEMKQLQQQEQQQQQSAATSNAINSLQQQTTNTNPRLVQIENEIGKTFEFYEQTLKERKEYLLKEMNTITQYALLNHTQSIGKQLQIQYQLDMKKQAVEKELSVDYEMYNQYSKQIDQLRQELATTHSSRGQENGCEQTTETVQQQQQMEEINGSISVLGELMAKIELDVKTRLGLIKELNNLLAINNQLIEKLKSTDPLSSIEFISNYSAIQTSIRNTFGYIRINQQQQQQQLLGQQQQQQQASNSNGSMFSNAATAGKQVPSFNQMSFLQQLAGNNNKQQSQSGVSNPLQNELSVICDLKLLNKLNNGSNDYLNPLSCNSQASLVNGPLSCNSQSAVESSSSQSSTALIQSPISYMRKTSLGLDELQSTNSEEQPNTTATIASISTNATFGSNSSSSASSSTMAETIKNVLTNSLGAEAVANYLSSLQSAATAASNNDSTASDLINQSLLGNQNEAGSNSANEQLIQLSAGSTSSTKSSKSLISNASSKSSSSSIAATATTSKHPLSHLYANFINNNPKLNTFNYLINSASEGKDEHDFAAGSNSKLHSKYAQSSSKTSLSTLLGASSTTATASMSSPMVLGSKSSTAAAAAAAQLQLNRSKMIYHCKFGEFGINDGQFTEPSGVTINTNNDIIVADTNSHRIQIFDKEGNFKFKFGECGKRDGQLLYPNRVSIVKQTGDIVVTERSPTHQIQIYNKYGHFVRKFGANILQHPRGVYVDYKARIVVVECKVMRVIIFDLYGNVLNKFNCSKYLEFPNGVCCSNPTNAGSNQREEIYISDNRAHCIKVFDYNGNFLRQIGGEGITNYPIGVGINANNEILVADNHNNFNLTVFTQEGKLINALESKVKHAQCFDVGLMDDGSIVLASKDYRIYVYKYTNSLDYLTNGEQSSSTVVAAANGQQTASLFSPTSSTSSNSSSSSSSSVSSANPFYNSAANSISNAFGYDLFADGHHHKIPNTLFSSDAHFGTNNSMFGFLNSASTATNNTSQSENLLNEADLSLVPFFGTNANFESSDLAIEEKRDGQHQQNLNNSSNQLNQSFSNLFNTKSSSNATNLVSMLNGFL